MSTKKWYKLDNAAKIFPSVTNKGRTNTFRVSMILDHEIKPEVLQEALEIVIKRFVNLNVKLKRGLFWYYFEPNDAKPKVVKESPYICQSYKRKDLNNFLFELSYYDNRITLETFHSLTDGTGAMEMLKSICFTYLKLMGYDVEDEGLVLTEDTEVRREELEDSFVKNYDPKVKYPRNAGRAMHFVGTEYDDLWLAVIKSIMDVNQLKEITKKYDCTITEFLGAAIIYSAYKSPNVLEKTKRPFKLFVPVNLRRFFPTQTLRNFSLFIRSSISFDKELTFKDILDKVKADFKDQIQKDKLQAQIVANVKLEKNFIMRIMPLFIKELVLKLGYKTWGEGPNSLSFSNLGVVQLPKSMSKYVKRINFTSGASRGSLIGIGVVSYNNQLVLSISSAMVERDFQKNLFRFLADEGLDIIIETNELEV